MKLPENHQTVMPYLILRDARRFLEFAQNVLDAEILTEHLDDENRILHAEIKIGESTIMIGQSNEFWGVNNAGMFIYVKDADSVYNQAMKQGAESIMEPSDKDYGRSSGVKDPFGNIWWITSIN